MSIDSTPDDVEGTVVEETPSDSEETVFDTDALMRSVQEYHSQRVSDKSDPERVPDPSEVEYRKNLLVILLKWITEASDNEEKVSRMKQVYERCMHRPSWFTVNSQGQLVPAC
jgi:hypothetical protein